MNMVDKGRWKKNTLLYLLLVLLAVVQLVPIYYLLVTTFKGPAEAATAPMALPSSFSSSPSFLLRGSSCAPPWAAMC